MGRLTYYYIFRHIDHDTTHSSHDVYDETIINALEWYENNKIQNFRRGQAEQINV